ncbi:MAG TPA: hypothetical protein VFU80_05065, partial [Sphingomicrobium sp.]|nr:hypothetical protein [Sphingomicrobium sp.]
DGFNVRDIDIGSSILLRGDGAAVAIPRSGAVPGMLQSIALPAPSTSVTRHGRALQMSYRAGDRAGSLSIPPRGQGRVLAVTFLGFDQAGNPYAYWEEGSGQGVDVWVGRFGARGTLSAGARLDLSDFVDVPAVPVAVTPAGTVLMMQPKEESIELSELALVDGRAGAVEEKLVGAPSVKVLDLGDSAAPAANAPYEAGRGRAAVPAYDPKFAAATLARAREFLDAQWTLKPGNFQQAGIQHNCEPPQGLYWTRPTRLGEEKVGEPVTAVPYKWGGFDSVEQFKRRVGASKPALAGNVCTCREPQFNGCMVARAAGVDCSGFVSRAWGLGAHNGTSRLAAIAAPLQSLFELKPGDILNRPGSHVRLFVRFEPGPEVRLRTLESAVSCGGVCERVYTPAQLQSYRPMRLRRR